MVTSTSRKKLITPLTIVEQVDAKLSCLLIVVLLAIVNASKQLLYVHVSLYFTSLSNFFIKVYD